MQSSVDEARSQIESLTNLCSRSADVFLRSAEAASDFELRAFLHDCARLRSEMGADLHTLMRDLAWESGGSDAELSPHQPAYEASAPVQNDVALLTACRQSEEQCVVEYRDAVEAEQPPEAVPLLRRQFAVIVATCERLRSLEQASARKPR